MRRVNCPHCGSLAVIHSTRTISILTKEHAVQCKDIECGHTFVCRTEIAYTVRPSGKPNPKVHLPVSARFRAVPPEIPPVPANDPGDLAAAEA